MPHIDIKHFPVSMDEASKKEFIASITLVVKSAFGCQEEAISIAIEPIDPKDWSDRVYEPEIVKREKWLHKRPGYGRLAENKKTR